MTPPACSALEPVLSPWPGASADLIDLISLVVITPATSLPWLPLIWAEMRQQWNDSRPERLAVSWLVPVSMTPAEWQADPLAATTARALGTDDAWVRAQLCLHKGDPRSMVGADERNAVLDRLPDAGGDATWLYFLDADNLLHPRFFRGVERALRSPGVLAASRPRMIFFEQIRKARRTEDAIVTFHAPRRPADVRLTRVPPSHTGVASSWRIPSMGVASS